MICNRQTDGQMGGQCDFNKPPEVLMRVAYAEIKDI